MIVVVVQENASRKGYSPRSKRSRILDAISFDEEMNDGTWSPVLSNEQQEGAGLGNMTHFSYISKESTMSSPRSDSNSQGSNSPRPPQRNLRVLVVDDSRLCQKLLVKGLAKAKIDTDTACNGQEAINLLTPIPCVYDAVLMDLRMPVMDGITATMICRDQLKLKIPIIVVSAEDESKMREQAITAGAAEYVTKPANMNQVLELIHQMTSGKNLVLNQ